MGRGMPGMVGMPGLNEILSDPEVLAAMQDPEVMVAFQDVAQNVANMSKYQSNPRVMKIVSQIWRSSIMPFRYKALLEEKQLRSPNGCCNNTNQCTSDLLMKKAGVL